MQYEAPTVVVLGKARKLTLGIAGNLIVDYMTGLFRGFRQPPPSN